MNTLDRFTTPRRVTHDERTGREVWQMTDGDFECVAAYMECGIWSADERYIVFACNRTGAWQPCRLDVATGEAQQIAVAENGGFRSINVHAESNEVYFWSGSGFTAVNLTTLEARTAVDFAAFGPLKEIGTGKGCTPVLNADASLIAIPRGAWADYAGPPSGMVLGSTDGTNMFEEVRVTHPDLADYDVGHLAFCPGDDDVLSFCKSHKDDVWYDGQSHHGHPPDANPFLHAREYRISRRTGEVKRLVCMEPGFRATHSVWGRSGDRIYSHRKHAANWVPTALVSVNREGEDLRVHYETMDHRLGHSQPSPDEQWIVSDSQDLNENILLLAHTRRNEQHMLCWPNMSIGSDRPDKRRADLPPHTDRHTHPGFSPTGKHCHCTSDVSGRSQVYVVPVDDVV